MLDEKYEIHFAPLQGYTDVAFRRAHAKIYGGVDFYYTPFIRIERGVFRKRDMRDLADEEMENCVPQVLPGSGEELKRLCEPIVESGFKRVDINVGCPFPPVMAHGRGCALLNNPEKLIDILDAVRVFGGDVVFSLKMRFGYDDFTQWRDVIDAINETPLRHVAMHARVAKQQYRGECNWEEFDDFMGKCKLPVLYNGDIRTLEDAERVVGRWPNVRGVMIGRGLIADLAFAQKLRGNDVADERERFRNFHNELYSEAAGRMTEGRQVAEHMKPYWEYFCVGADRRVLKMIKKARTGEEYLGVVNSFLNGNV